MSMRKKLLSPALAGLMLALGAPAFAAEAETVLGRSNLSECIDAAAAAEQTGKAAESGLLACQHALMAELSTTSDRVEALLSRGVLLLTQGKNALAIKDFDQALKLKPTSSAALNDRGIAHYALHHYDLAVSDFSASLALSPEHPERVLFNRALAYEDQRDLKRAYLDYRQAAELNPTWDKPAHELARFTVARSPES